VEVEREFVRWKIEKQKPPFIGIIEKRWLFSAKRRIGNDGNRQEHQSADNVESCHRIEIKHEDKLFFLKSYDNQSESNHDKSAENIEIGHNLINVIIHKIFP